MTHPTRLITRGQAKELWRVMRESVLAGTSDASPDYLMGFSHGLYLRGIITQTEWSSLTSEIHAFVTKNQSASAADALKIRAFAHVQ